MQGLNSGAAALPQILSHPTGPGPQKTESAPKDPWTECAEVIEEHHKWIVKRWKEEIDTLLVYAGLFSAVLTAFNVELYKLLQPDGTDTTNALLAQLLFAHLNGSSLNSGIVNSTLLQRVETVLPSTTSFQAASSAVWINTLWFSSLVCSLSAASLGMMVKQWLHETELGLSGTSRDMARLRQYRLNSLRKWRVGAIVETLPVLLQVASALFLAGLLVLLWTLHPVVAGVASAIVVILFIFLCLTLLIPAFSEDCAYRSPQSLALFIAVQGICRGLPSLAGFISAIIRIISKSLESFMDNSAAPLNWNLSISSLPPPLLLILNVRRPQGALSVVWGRYRGWAGLERAVVRTQKDDLDVSAVETAHILRLDDPFTHGVLRLCASLLPSPFGSQCVEGLIENQIRHLGEETLPREDFRPYFDDALNMALLNVHEYLQAYGSHATLDLQDRTRLTKLAKSLRRLSAWRKLFGPSGMASRLTGENLQDLCSLLTRSIEVKHWIAETIIFNFVTGLILESPWDQSSVTGSHPPAGLRWNAILGQDNAGLFSVTEALSNVLRKGSCRRWSYQVRFKACISLIKVFGISCLQDPSNAIQSHTGSGDRYSTLAGVFSACARDNKALALGYNSVPASYVETAQVYLSTLSRERPESTRITGELETSLREALSRTTPRLLKFVVSYRDRLFMASVEPDTVWPIEVIVTSLFAMHIIIWWLEALSFPL